MPNTTTDTAIRCEFCEMDLTDMPVHSEERGETLCESCCWTNSPKSILTSCCETGGAW